MKKVGKKFWTAGLAAGFLLAALSCTAYGSQEGPGVENGQELPAGGMYSGGVIRRDSKAVMESEKAASSGQATEAE